MKKTFLVFALSILLVLTACGKQETQSNTRKAVAVVMDGSDSSKNALIRLSLYANEFDIKGIYNTDKNSDLKSWFETYAQDYEKVSEQLQKFDENYPKSIKDLYQEEDLETLLKTKDLYVLNWTEKGLEEQTLSDAIVLSTHDVQQDAKEKRIFKDYAPVFGETWETQNAVYRKSLNENWIKENLINSNSPLFNHYILEEGKFIGELESLTFLSILNNGLNPLDNPEHGSWGGRLVKQGEVYDKAAVDFNEIESKEDANYSLQRFIDVLQLDFANRVKASVEEAVVLPKITLDQASEIEAKANETVMIKASLDNEETKAYFKWVRYEEVDSYEGDVALDGWGSSSLSFTVPEDAKTGDTIHLVLELEEASTGLKTYQRVIVSVK